MSPVDFVGRQPGLSLQKGRCRVVDPVVKDHDIGPVTGLKFPGERDHFLRAHIADLRQILELDTPPFFMERTSQQRGNRLVVARAEPPERGTPQREDLDRSALAAIGW